MSSIFGAPAPRPGARRPDPFNLRRFADKQSAEHVGIDQALRELRSGRKCGHWIWWNLPQPLRGKISRRSRRYAIRSDAEAAAYLAYCRGNVSLRNNLLELYRTVLAQVEGTKNGGKSNRKPTPKPATLLSLLGTTDKDKLLRSLVLWRRVAAMVEDAELGKVVDELSAAVKCPTGDEKDGIGLDLRFYNNKNRPAAPGRGAAAAAAPAASVAMQQLMHRCGRHGSALASTTLTSTTKLPPRVQAGLREVNAVLQEAAAKHKEQSRQQYCNRLNAPPHEIAPGVFLGGIGKAKSVESLRRAGVTHVLNCAPSVVRTGEQWYLNHGLRLAGYAQCDAYDRAESNILQEHLTPALELFRACRSEGGVLFVHCFAGGNRSATLALACLVTAEGRDLLGAVSEACAVRPGILYNESFRRQLVELALKEGRLGGDAGARKT